jgi:hypothetical protein
VFEMTDPQTMWLNITNIGLGVVTLICLLVIARAILQELKSRKSKIAEADDHAFAVEGLGLTMADGGDKIEKARKE